MNWPIRIILTLYIISIPAAFSYTISRRSMTWNECPLCEDDACRMDPVPANCNFGIVSDLCGRRMCAKGPNEFCGHSGTKYHGECGAGMLCKCNICIGCSTISYTCHIPDSEPMCVLPESNGFTMLRPYN